MKPASIHPAPRLFSVVATPKSEQPYQGIHSLSFFASPTGVLVHLSVLAPLADFSQPRTRVFAGVYEPPSLVLILSDYESTSLFSACHFRYHADLITRIWRICISYFTARRTASE